MRTAAFGGVVLTLPGEKVRQSHSVFLEEGNMTWVGRLSGRIGEDGTVPGIDGSDLIGLFSVLGRNYQICNGGLQQYYCNGYHLPRPPSGPGDVALAGAEGQRRFVHDRLGPFARAVLPGDMQGAWTVYTDLMDAQTEGDCGPWEDDDRRCWEDDGDDDGWEAALAAWDRFDRRYFGVCGVFETVAELFAQYLVLSSTEE